MSWSIGSKYTRSVESKALAAAVRRAGNSVAAVGLWVVWMRGGQVLACEWSPRLDAEVPVEVRVDADTVVVIALAPTRLAHPVIARTEVICEYFQGKGFRVHAVHIRKLRDGELWTSLRGRARAGIVPSSAARPILAHRPELPRLGAALVSRSRLLVAAAAAVATLLGAAPAVGAPPSGQPGLSIEPPSGGQAGVTAPPRTAAPIAGPADTDTTAIVMSEQDSGADPAGSPTVAVIAVGPGTASSGTGAPAAFTSSGSSSIQEQATPVTEVADTVGVGAVVVARPEWMPESLAARECAWNAFLTDQAAIVVENTGLAGPDIDAVLGTDSGGEPAPMPQELVTVQAVLADPRTVVEVAADLAEPILAEAGEPLVQADPPVAEAIESVLSQWLPR